MGSEQSISLLPKTFLGLPAYLPVPCGFMSEWCLRSSDSSSACYGTRILRIVVEFN